MPDAVANALPLTTGAGEPSPAVVLELVSAGGCALSAIACDAAMKALTPAHHTLGWRVAMPDGLARAVAVSVVLTLAVAPPLLETVVLLAHRSSTSPAKANAARPDALWVRDVATGHTRSFSLDSFAVPPPGTVVPVGTIHRSRNAWVLREPAASPIPIQRLPTVAVLLG